MPAPKIPIAVALASTDHGTMIVNRFDYNMTSPNQGYGVGFMLWNTSSYDMDEATMIMTLLDLRRANFGDGVVAVDAGANIGVFSVEWSRHMSGWGRVISIEAQERVFHALAGNIAINNCFNATPIFAAVSSQPGQMRIRVPNYFAPASFGSLELRQRENTEAIGQPIDYSEEKMATVRTLSIDSLQLPRLDFLKVDVEGMEMEALEGARRSVESFRPVMFIENAKADRAAIAAYLAEYGYKEFQLGMNVLAIHANDPAAGMVQVVPPSGG